MSEHKWLTSRRLQEAHLYISPEFNWDSAPLTPSDPTLLVSAEGDSDLHSTTKLLHFTDHKPQKIIVWKEHTGSTHPVHLTQSTAHFGILSILKESHTRKKFGKLPAPCTKTELRWAEKGVDI
ncbi:uncharacterized protein LOC113961500 isoform X3 [Neopelma chrysocephalum]|uniref:uncharacterized protein LOC113961500 isoform X3 n=1 Tax=Neopelma chrysocephalum TaxID=114329 RepID=UPI000FCD03B0|nr:uncharacterized protein LOC113961500 isoform X3 [Neopelma chrysocephalum]